MNVNGPAVAPDAVLVTVMVPFFVPRPPLFKAGDGAEIVSVAPVTVNATVLRLFPLGVVTLTLCVPKPALLAITKLAVSVVELVTFTLLTVIPVPVAKPTVVPLVVKFVPVTVTPTVVPRTPELGTIETTVARLGFCTVNVTVLDVPFGVATLMFLAPNVAFAGMANVAVT